MWQSEQPEGEMMDETAEAPQEQVQAAPAGLFARRSSGLVREVGALDTLLYGVAAIALPYTVFIVAAWVNYPGASMELAIILTVAGAIPAGITYALFASVYPRSGGEYVFLSRVIHPVIGFTMSVSQAFWQAFYVGINGAFWALFGLSPMFAILAVQADSTALADISTFFTKDYGIFLTGFAGVLFFTVMLIRGAKVFFRVQRWALFIAFASMGLMIFVLFLGTIGVIDFKQNFDALAGSGAYDKAAASKTDLTPGFSLTETLKFMIWPAFSLAFSVLAVAFGGEIRNIKRSTAIGIPGAMAISGIAMLALAAFTVGTTGADFLLSTSANGLEINAPPFMNVYASIAGDSTVLTVLMNLWILILMPYAIGVALLYSSRCVLAWSIDGIMPKQLADVSPRSHAPVKATLLIALIGVIMLALYAFTDLLAILAGLLGIVIVFLAVNIAGILFPYLKPEVYRNSPARITFLGLPLIVVTGTLGSIFLAFIGIRAAIDDSFGANTPTSVRMTIIVLVASVVWFYVARAIGKRRGEDIDRRFTEIPID
jgi:amino acid transporter